MKYEEIRERLRRLKEARDTFNAAAPREKAVYIKPLLKELDLFIQDGHQDDCESQTGVPKGVNRDLLDVWSGLRRDIQEAKDKHEAHLQEAFRWKDKARTLELELAELELKKAKKFGELFQAIADSYK